MELGGATAVLADDAPPQISVGAGMRTGFTDEKVDGAAKSTDEFDLDSVRLYVNGSVTNNIKFTFNTEYTGDTAAPMPTRLVCWTPSHVSNSAMS